MNHKAVNHTVKESVVVETFTAILLKVCAGYWRFFKVELNFDVTKIGMQGDHEFYLRIYPLRARV
ncbi:Uncharacterised protein [Vibrio cholerae]|nr:Uncharacterised protein [Vibrio cholerae]CSA13053.1 Uncharacterised protein [Vibrio cholerae]